MPDYPKDQLWQLYKELPKDLQEAGFSEKVTQNIHEICAKNDISDEDIIFDVIKNVGYVFLGLLPPNELQDILEYELKIEKVKAEKIANEISRFVFLPLKKSLEALYKIKIKPGIKPTIDPSVKEIFEEEKPKKKDTYREPIE